MDDTLFNSNIFCLLQKCSEESINITHEAFMSINRILIFSIYHILKDFNDKKNIHLVMDNIFDNSRKTIFMLYVRNKWDNFLHSYENETDSRSKKFSSSFDEIIDKLKGEPRDVRAELIFSTHKVEEMLKNLIVNFKPNNKFTIYIAAILEFITNVFIESSINFSIKYNNISTITFSSIYETVKNDSFLNDFCQKYGIIFNEEFRIVQKEILEPIFYDSSVISSKDNTFFECENFPISFIREMRNETKNDNEFYSAYTKINNWKNTSRFTLYEKDMIIQNHQL